MVTHRRVVMNPLKSVVITSAFALLLVVVPSRAAQPTAASTRPANPIVLVLPIAPPEGGYSWIGRAIQQDIVVDLSQMTHARTVAPATAPAIAADADAALRAGRDSAADYVVFGHAQVLA